MTRRSEREIERFLEQVEVEEEEPSRVLCIAGEEPCAPDPALPAAGETVIRIPRVVTQEWTRDRDD